MLNQELNPFQLQVKFLQYQFAVAHEVCNHQELDNQCLSILVEHSQDMISLASLNGDIIYLNPAGKALVGLKHDFTQRPIRAQEFFSPEDFLEAQSVLANLAQQKSIHRELWLQHFQTRERIPVACHAFCIPHPETGEPIGFGSINRDSRPQRQTEAQLRQLLHEKELLLQQKERLLQEVHHRVKNNLQLITSLINLQRQTLSDPAAAIALQTSQTRIQALAMIYEQLDESDRLAQLNLTDYIPGLTHYLYDVATINHTLETRFDLEPVCLSADAAIACGLVLHELIHNAIHHAFPDQTVGTLIIQLRLISEGNPDLQTCQILIQDDGVGLPPEINPHQSDTLGFQLVTSLLKKLRGTLEYDRALNSFQIQFPIDP
ncbi:sensor histidine kinase [Alkalinema pantanalense CENA528]|uniref:sensor histidine kinase n=1 Tax=Alkalinema pantanalense TaxID=1620705 RepID=UPI003D6DB434